MELHGIHVCVTLYDIWRVVIDQWSSLSQFYLEGSDWLTRSVWDSPENLPRSSTRSTRTSHSSGWSKRTKYAFKQFSRWQFHRIHPANSSQNCVNFHKHANKPFFRFSQQNWIFSTCDKLLIFQRPKLIWSLDTRALIEYMTSGDCMALVLGRFCLHKYYQSLLKMISYRKTSN